MRLLSSTTTALTLLFFFSYMCVSVWLQWVSVDELCSEEGFKGVWVSRS
eukprot:COSAG02_NODE_73433_length_174_cov_974.152778_1_plen_48_part_10